MPRIFRTKWARFTRDGGAALEGQHVDIKPAQEARLASERSAPTLLRLTLVLLWIGATSFGGSTPPYFFQEFVRRRSWVSPEDFTEAYAVGRLLPGPTGANTLAYLIQSLRGPLIAAYCLIPYTLPSVLIMLLFTALLTRAPGNPYVHGALAGAAMAGIGVLVATVFQMTASASRARLWPLFIVAAFLSGGLLATNFFLTLLVLSALSLAVNLPEGRRSEE
jgi:chromate transporter